MPKETECLSLLIKALMTLALLTIMIGPFPGDERLIGSEVRLHRPTGEALYRNAVSCL